MINIPNSTILSIRGTSHDSVTHNSMFFIARLQNRFSHVAMEAVCQELW